MCFLDIACYCLNKNADFTRFRKDCVKLNGWNDIFVINNSSQTSDVSLFHVTCIAFCKKFVDFQIDLFVKTYLFPLRTVYCRYSWARTNIDFDYETDNFLEVYYNTDNGSDSDSDSDEQTNCFTSSVWYSKIRANMMFERFCESCQNVFLVYFARKLHVISNSIS